MSRKAQSLDQFGDLVGDIYQCALEPARWSDALSHFVSVFSPPDWDVAALMWEGINAPSVRWVGTTGLVAHAIQGYQAAHAGTNAWSVRTTQLAVGRVVDTDEILSRAEFLKSDLYQHFLKTWSMELAVFIIFERTTSEQLALSMPGPDGRDISGIKRGMRLIAPHVQRATRIGHGLAEARLRSAGAEAALELGHVAIMALKQDLTIVSKNDKAAALAAQKVFRISGGRVAFEDQEAQKQIAALAQSTAPASVAFRVADATGANHAVLAMTIRPQREAVLGGWVEGARILVSISNPHPTPLLEVNRLCAWFDFTPSEARLAAALTTGQSLADYAEARGVGVEAARYLLKAIFRKAEVNSQAQLVTVIKNLPEA